MLITPRKLCELLSIAPRTAERWRREGKGPPAIRLGGRSPRYRYDLAEVRAWLAERGGRIEATDDDEDQLIDDRELARLTSWSVSTIRTRRCRGLPMPTVTHVGRLVRYRRRDVDAFLEGHRAPRHAVLQNAANNAGPTDSGRSGPVGGGGSTDGATVGGR